MTTLALVSTVLPGTALADEQPPAIPIIDLPPFPEVTDEDDNLGNLAIIDAQRAEEDVVVGASKREQSLGSVASAVTVISADQLQRFGFRTVAEALGTVSGMYIVDDRMIERVGIRGVQLLGDANTRILILIDGSPLNEPWSQYVDTSYALPIHLDDVARLEVIRGPVSSVYGTNAFLGIINIVTLGADKAPPVYGRVGGGSFGSVTGNAGFGYGTVDRQVRGNFAYVRRSGEEDLGYPVPGGATPFTTGADALDAYNGAVQVHFDRFFFQIRGHTRTRELPGAPYDSTIGVETNRNTDQQLLGELGYNQDLSDLLSIAGRLYVDRYRFRGVLEYDDYDGMPATFETIGNSLWYGGELRGLFELSDFMPKDGKLGLTLGVAAEFSQTDSETTLTTASDPDAAAVAIDTPFNTQGVYAELEVEPVAWLAATAGARLDLNSQFENNLSPRSALFLKRGNSLGVKLLFAQGFRNPSVFEAFFQDGERYLPACGTTCDLDPVLRPERITSYEGVIWGRPLPGTKVRLSVWNWQLTDLIEKRSVFDPDPDVLDVRLQYQNVASIQSTGIELEASYRDTRGWFGFGNVSFANVVRNEGDAPNAPVIVGKLGVSSPPIANVVHVSSTVSVVGERMTRDEDVVADPHVSWNGTLYVPDIQGVDVTVGVRNILGQRQQVPAQVDYDRQNPDAFDVLLIPGPGREFFGRLGYRF